MRALFLLTLAFVAACGPAPQPELDPVIVVLCADVDPSMPPHPCCTGFVLAGEVVTANHCAPGAMVSLVTRKQWTETANASEIGTVTRRDAVRDIAWLTAAVDGPGLTQGAPVTSGDAVRVLTSSDVLPGVVGDTVGVFWQSTANTQFGDSGSAVVDTSGRAVGVLSRCLTADGKACDPNTGIFAELP